MYVVVRRYSGASALVDAMVQGAQAVRDLISTVPGFQAYYAVRTGSGGVTTVTVCDDKAGTDESTRRAAAWVGANVAGGAIAPPEVSEGETYLNF